MKCALIFLTFFALFPNNSIAADDRKYIEMPAMMQEHMLANMRDHLKALNEIFLALSKGHVSEASTIAEKRLGLSSLDDHGASHFAAFMPEPMRSFGSGMHQAASRFATIIETSDIEQTEESKKEIFSALQEITNACTSCHEAYRIR